MADNLIIARTNAYGLSRDVEIVERAIHAAGGVCRHVTPRGRPALDRLLGRKIARHAFHIERAHPQWFSAVERNFLIPNQERYPRRHLKRLDGIERVLAKTRHAEQVFSAENVATSFVGFASRDVRVPRAPGKIRILHLAGGSTLKGTEDVVALWRRRPDWPELILVQKSDNAPSDLPANVTLRAGHLDAEQLIGLQNDCRIHLCPSRSEGWGHHIVEAMACGALIVTTDAPPMNEHVTDEAGILVPANRHAPRHLGTNYYVDPAALEAAIDRAIVMPQNEFIERGKAAREMFEGMESDFAKRFSTFVAR